MKYINILVAALALSLSFTTFNAMAAGKSTVKARVVFQVSDNDSGKWNLALNNAKNVQQALGAKHVKVEIVAYGPGIGMLKLDSTVGNRVAESKQAGVTIVACQNTMKNMKLTSADMLPNTSYVPAGVVELIKKQKQGYAYIRP